MATDEKGMMDPVRPEPELHKRPALNAGFPGRETPSDHLQSALRMLNRAPEPARLRVDTLLKPVTDQSPLAVGRMHIPGGVWLVTAAAPPPSGQATKDDRLNCNRVMLMAKLLLRTGVFALVLVVCGADAAVAVARPLALPPAPLPFQPQTIGIASGASWQGLSLMNTEAGGSTLNGEPVSSGATQAASNGYCTLTFSDGIGIARIAPELMDVRVGSNGQSVTLTQSRTGGYGVDGPAIQGRDTYIASNGNYILTMAGGVMTTAFDPMLQEIPPGASGDSVMLVHLETGGYSLNGEPITADTAAKASNGATYGIGRGPNGPMAESVPTTFTVMLGMHGGELTLTLAEDQVTYLRHGEVFKPGTVVTSNERDYTVSLVDGEWIAELIKPMPTVDLGNSGLTVTLIQAEARGWWLGPETPIARGDTYTVGANDYTMTLSDGVWTATFTPKMMDVTLGTSGDSIAVTQVEAGGYIYNDRGLSDGAHAKATNGATYAVVVDEDGIPVATYVPRPVTVHLGDLGGTITLLLQEDQVTWVLEGETEPLTSGRVISIESIGNTYTVTLGEDGVWTAVYNEVEVTVDLGTSGDVLTLIRDEMGGWWTDSETPFQSGETRTAGNGNVYRLTLEDGEWIDTYLPVTMPLPGTGLTAARNEDQSAAPGYHIVEDPDQKLDETGLGDVTSPAGNFRVHMDDDGNLVAVRYEAAVNGRNDGKAGYSIGGVSVIGDDAGTVPNEAGTMITIDGINHSTDQLFNTGMSTVEGDTVVAGVLEEVGSLVAQIKGLIAVNELEGEDRTDFTQAFNDKWKAIDTALNRVFGHADDEDATLDHLDVRPRRVEAMVAMLDAIVAALSDADAFAAAISDGGVFEGLIADKPSTRIPDAFNAIALSATAYLARTENTRFGIFTRQERSVADSTFDDATFGVFAYSPMKATRHADLPSIGSAFYLGRTMAVDRTGKTIYNGDISLQVRFRAKRLSGVVENLRDAEGRSFLYGSGTVAAIILPEATIMNGGSFIKDAERTGQIVFTADPGSLRAISLTDRQVNGAVLAGSSFSGQLVGDGAAAIGTWAINASSDDSDNLSGGFGVERAEDVTDLRPEVVGGGTSRTSLDETLDGISAVNETGVITLATGLTVNGADLFESGGTTIIGRGFVAEVIEDIRSELRRLSAVIALDELGEETAADDGRTAVWTALATALDALVGSGNGAQIFSTGDYVTTNDDDTRADANAKEIIAKVLEALSSETKFRSAVRQGGVLYGNSGLITGDNAAIDAVFSSVMSMATVEYGSTAYTRFGAWNRVATTTATTAPSDSGLDPANGVFAYSPLAATAYATNDPNFPAGASATYEGTTIARGNDAGNTYYQGTIMIGVTWASSPSDAANVGNIRASITGLRNAEDLLYTSGGTDVESILFTAADINVSRSAETSALSFASGTTTTRLRYADLRIADTDASATLDGMFVGKVIDGPLAIIGSWSLNNSNGDNLAGAYGAELLP